MQLTSYVELRLDALRVGLRLRDVERVLRSAALVAVPGAPACLLGMLNLGGQPTPVYDTRQVLGLASKPLHPDDRFVLTHCAGCRAAFVADEVVGTFTSGELLRPNSFGAHAGGLRGVATLPDGMVFVHDLNRFMFLERAIPVMADA